MPDFDVASINTDVYDDDESSLLSVQEAADDDGRSELRAGQERYKTIEQAMKALDAGVDTEQRGDNEEDEDEEESGQAPSTPRPESARDVYGAGVWPRGSLEQTPLLDAPPDYAQAVGYRTFSTQPHQSATAYRRRGQGDERGSLATPQDDDDGDVSRKKLPSYVRRNWRQVCLLNLVVYSFLVTTVLVVKHFATQHVPDRTIHAVKYPDHVTSWAFGRSPDGHERARVHKSTSDCAFNSYRQLGFSQGMRMANFTFIEAIEPSPDSNFSDIRISGNIDIRPAPYDQHEAAVIWLSLATTSPLKVVEPVHEYLDDGSVLRFPELERTDGPDAAHLSSRARGIKKPCLDFYIGIYVRNSFDSWHMSSTVGNIDIGYPRSFDPELNWFFYVLKEARISTTQGNISADYLDSPNIDIQATKGSIKGNYSFDDRMSVTTTSGEIDILINQSARQRLRSHASTLESSTVSGDTHLSLHHEELPEDWIPRMEQYNLESHHQTHSGDIFLNYTGWEGVMKAGARLDKFIHINGTDLGDCSAHHGSRVSKDAAGEKMVCRARGSLNSTSRVESAGGDIEVNLGDQLVYWPAVTV